MAEGESLDWFAKKLSGTLANRKNIRSMKPGESWVAPGFAGDAKFINDTEEVRPRDIALHQREEPELTDEFARGGKVLNKKWWRKK